MRDCGATLIGPDVVLGAAHCGSAIGRSVTIGHGGTTVSLTIIDQRIHPNVNRSTFENDFSLYRLNMSVMTAGARLILNTDRNSPSPGQPLTTMGYGTTSEVGSLSTSLRDVVVPAVSDDDCLSAYGNLRFKPNTMFCAGVAGKDACHGDSGGPIVIRNGDQHVLVGVVSWGEGCARPEFPGIYARVSAVTSWIRSVACDEWKSSVNGLCDSSVPSPVSNVVTSLPTKVPTPAPTSARPTGTPGPTTAPPVTTNLPTTTAPIAPTVSPLATPPPSSTGGGGGTCTELIVELRTDDWPEENIVTLTNRRGVLLWNYQTFEPNTEYIFTRCLPNHGCSTFDVTDTYGDGLDGEGWIKVTLGSEIVYEDSELGHGFNILFGTRC